LNGAAPASYAATVLSVLWIATVTNFFNFMDGIDGLACSQAVASCLGIVLAAWSADAAVIAAATGGACLGFLFHNWPPARVFMGDSGSGFLGFVLAALPLLAPRESTASAVVAVAIGLSLFLLDPLITLLRRARAGKHLLQAHREHLYQQLVQPDEPTRKVTTAYFFAGLLLALGGVVGYREPRLFWLGIVMAAAAFGVLWHVVNARSHRRSRTT
jgi:UDP-N-acetylmuramyl pentapeptide phosphotransferase/UDP-N-acetylglucosamine-1-phosphate transferase